MYKLYARKNTGSAAVEALLTLLGVPFELIDVAKTNEAKAPDWYYKINPRGEVPTLELPDGSVMTESAAMMIYLADAHPAAVLAPDLSTPAHAQYLRWMIYLASAAYNSDLRLYYPERYSTDQSDADAIKAKAIADLARDFEILNYGMGEGPYILGETFSGADLYAAMILSWSNDVPALFAKHPKLKRLFDLVKTNPKVHAIWQRNNMV